MKLYFTIILASVFSTLYSQDIENLFVHPKEKIKFGVFTGISHQSVTKLFDAREFYDLGRAERSISIGIQLEIFPENNFNFKLRSSYNKGQFYNRGYDFTQSILANLYLGKTKRLYLHSGLLSTFDLQGSSPEFKFAHSLGLGYLIPISNKTLFIEFQHDLFFENYAGTFNDDEKNIHLKYFSINVGIKF